MTDYTIEREVTVEAPIEVVWRTITEPDLIARWFADEVKITATPGAVGTLTFRHEDGREPYTSHLAVVQADSPHALAYRWEHPAGVRPVPGNSTLVTFTLVEVENGTRLTVTESEIGLLDRSDAERRDYHERHQSGWEHQLGRLAALFGPGGS